MPIYEYSCENCGHAFELLQKMNESTTQKCESCGQKKAHRAISQSSFLLKGKGWYTTDYAGKKAHGIAPAEPSCAASGTCSSSSCPAKQAS